MILKNYGLLRYISIDTNEKKAQTKNFIRKIRRKL